MNLVLGAMTDLIDPVRSAQQAFALGEHSRAQELALLHLRSFPNSLSAQSVLANASNALRDFAQATAALDALHAALPRDTAIRKALAMACNNRGSQLFHTGDLDNAVMLYERATRLDEELAVAWTNLASCAAQRGYHDLAAHCYERLLTLDPESPQATIGLARALRARGQEHAADALLRAVSNTCLSDENGIALAEEFERIGHPDRAEAIFASGDPHFDCAAHARLANVQRNCSNTAGARQHLDWIVRHTHGEARERFRAERDTALMLPTIFADHTDIVEARAAYDQRMQQFIEDWAPARLTRAGIKLDDLRYTRYRIAYHGEGDLALAARYGNWLAASARQLLPEAATISSPRLVRRVGMVCAHWTRSSITSYFGAWPGALRAAGIEIFLYGCSRQEDAISRGIAAQVDRAALLPDDLADAARQLRADACDLLIYPEVGLSAAPEVLSSLRLAPRQWVAWGHPVTTGLPTIDRYLSVAAMEPTGAQDNYCEPLGLLPGIGTRFTRAALAAPGSRASYGLPESGALYLLPHPPIKLHPDTDELVAAILCRDPTARVVFFADDLQALTLLHRRRLQARLARDEIGTAGRLFWLPRLSANAFRALLACADVVVDALHFSGGATSLETLAQNTPIVSVEGRYMRGRQTSAMLRMTGLPDLICADVENAAARAVEIAQSAEQSARLRTLLAERTPLLFDQTESLRALCAQVCEGDGLA